MEKKIFLINTNGNFLKQDLPQVNNKVKVRPAARVISPDNGESDVKAESLESTIQNSEESHDGNCDNRTSTITYVNSFLSFKITMSLLLTFKYILFLGMVQMLNKNQILLTKKNGTKMVVRL